MNVLINTMSGKPISKIGIGSYGVGGRGHRDVPITDKLDDQIYVDALAYSLTKGINFLEISVGYGHGLSLALFKRALDKSNIKREDIFLTHSLYPRDLSSIDSITKDVANFCEVMNTNYADSTLVTQTLMSKFGEEKIYDLLNDLIDSKKTRYVSLSNASPNTIRRFKEEFKDKFIAHEGHLSFEVRELQYIGVFDLCDNLGVANIIWRPLRKNKTSSNNWGLLVELATKYSKTQNQIVLNWMCQLGYHPMVMSTNKKHIDENIDSTNFVMTKEDYSRINTFKILNYTPRAIDWEGESIDGDIVELANEFEKYVKR